MSFQIPAFNLFPLFRLQNLRRKILLSSSSSFHLQNLPKSSTSKSGEKMATISQFKLTPSLTFASSTPKHSKFSPKAVFLPLNSIKTAQNPAVKLQVWSNSGRPELRVRVGEFEEDPISEDAAVAVVEEPEKDAEIESLKKALVDSFYGTDSGLSATSETRAEIVELITQLEAKNPTPAPTEALTLLNGKWILAYTSFPGMFPLLTRGTQLIKVEEISQTIDAETFTVQNSVLLAGPLATSSISTNAKFEVRSPKRVQIKFEEGVIGTPKLTDSIVFPDSVEFFGQNLDLSPFKGIITSVQDTASSVAKTISSQPPFKFSFSSSNAESWLLTTYLDEELRISRGDAGSVFVLIKEGSSLLTP